MSESKPINEKRFLSSNELFKKLNVNEIRHLSLYLRMKVFEICKQSGSGHIGGSSSSVELMTALYFGGVLNYDVKNLRHPDRDRVLVRGHLGPIRYPIFSILGEVAEEELKTYREFGSRLQGHEEHQHLPGVDITPSGSLGMLLSYGVGAAIASKDSGKNYKTFVFLGDGEEQEGNVSEAARHAACLNLDNLIVILDKNNKQLSNPVSDTDKSDILKTWSGYGWKTIEIKDGHNVEGVIRSLKKARNTKGPVIVVANTTKGFGLHGAADHFSGYHTIRTCPSGVVDSAISNLSAYVNKNEDLYRAIFDKIKNTQGNHNQHPEAVFEPVNLNILPVPSTSENLNYAQSEYFQRLGKIICQDRNMRALPIYFLTADVVRSDEVEAAELKKFSHFYNVGIREQHMISMAHGLSLSAPESRILVSSFDAFTYRLVDQLNSLAIGGGSVVIIGDVAGISNSKNGATHQSSGQPAALLGIHGVKMLEPADVHDLYNCLNWAIGQSRGPIYIRVHNSAVSEVVDKERSNERNLRYYAINKDAMTTVDLTIVASGLAVSHAIKAARLLEEHGIVTQVINVLDQTALDSEFVQLLPHGKPVLTVYNGQANILQGNVSRAIMEHATSALPSKVIGHGFSLGTSGSLEDLLKSYCLDAEGIASVALQKL